MSSSQFPCSADLLSCAKEIGAAALAIIDAGPVDSLTAERSRQWLREGNHATMAYLEKYEQIRNDPRLLLPGASSLIIVAFPYYSPLPQRPDALRIARFARGDDYHEVVSRRLRLMADYIKQNFGGDTRVCVDTAPLRERYWALRANLGFIGRNCCLIIPGIGSYCFIGVIVTTAKFQQGRINIIPSSNSPAPSDPLEYANPTDSSASSNPSEFADSSECSDSSEFADNSDSSMAAKLPAFSDSSESTEFADSSECSDSSASSKSKEFTELTNPLSPSQAALIMDKARNACVDCGRCIASCPNDALPPAGYQIDARRCIAYLTIEHKGDFPEGVNLHGSFYGCDRCQDACPYNAKPLNTDIPELLPRPSILSLTPEQMDSMDQQEFSRFFRHSAMKRAKLVGLLRNLHALNR